MEPLFVPDDLDSDKTASLVIDATHYLSKTALAQEINDFIAIRQVVTKDNVVVAPLIVISKIGGLCVEIADVLLSAFGSTEVDLLVVDDLPSLENVEVDHL